MDTAKSYTDAYAVAYTYSLCSIERLYLNVGLAVMLDSKIDTLVWPYIDVGEKLFPPFLMSHTRSDGLVGFPQPFVQQCTQPYTLIREWQSIELYSFQYFKNLEIPREQDNQLQVLRSARRRYRFGEVCVCVCEATAKPLLKKYKSVNIIN